MTTKTTTTTVIMPGGPEAVSRRVRNDLADMLGDLQQAQAQIAGLLRHSEPENRDLFIHRLENVRGYLVSAENIRAGLLKVKD